jgi:hypothetical protein
MEIRIRKARKWMRQKYHFVVIADNYKIIATGENVTNVKDCNDTAIRIRGKNDWPITFEWEAD